MLLSTCAKICFLLRTGFLCLLQNNGGVAKWTNCFQNKTNTLLVFKKFEYNWIAAFRTNLFTNTYTAMNTLTHC